MNVPERTEYIRTHRGKIEAIKETTTQIIDMMDPFSVVKEGDSAPLSVVSGEPTAFDMYETHLHRGVEINGDEADRLAVYQSRVLRKQAEIAILGLQASVTLLRCNEQAYDNGFDTSHAQETDTLVQYAQACHTTAEAYSVDNKHVQLSFTQLEELDNGDNVANHEIVVDDGVLIQSLAIASLNMVARNIKHEVRALEGGFVTRCAQVLGEEYMAPVVSILGRTTTEAEIDILLGGIWATRSLKEGAGDIALLLNDIRKRALLAQRAREMNGYMGDTSLPSEDKLDEFGRLLGLK